MVDALGPKHFSTVRQVKRAIVNDEKPKRPQQQEKEDPLEDEDEHDNKRKGSKIDDHA